MVKWTILRIKEIRRQNHISIYFELPDYSCYGECIGIPDFFYDFMGRFSKGEIETSEISECVSSLVPHEIKEQLRKIPTKTYLAIQIEMNKDSQLGEYPLHTIPWEATLVNKNRFSTWGTEYSAVRHYGGTVRKYHVNSRFGIICYTYNSTLTTAEQLEKVYENLLDTDKMVSSKDVSNCADAKNYFKTFQNENGIFLCSCHGFKTKNGAIVFGESGRSYFLTTNYRNSKDLKSISQSRASKNSTVSYSSVSSSASASNVAVANFSSIQSSTSASNASVPNASGSFSVSNASGSASVSNASSSVGVSNASSSAGVSNASKDEKKHYNNMISKNPPTVFCFDACYSAYDPSLAKCVTDRGGGVFIGNMFEARQDLTGKGTPTVREILKQLLWKSKDGRHGIGDCISIGRKKAAAENSYNTVVYVNSTLHPTLDIFGEVGVPVSVPSGLILLASILLSLVISEMIFFRFFVKSSNVLFHILWEASLCLLFFSVGKLSLPSSSKT